MTRSATPSRHDRRMAAWRAAKLDFRNAGRKNWKAGKKKIKRLMRDSRRNARAAHNALIDNGLLASHA